MVALLLSKLQGPDLDNWIDVWRKYNIGFKGNPLINID